MKQPIIANNPALIHVGGLISGGLLELGESLGLRTTDHSQFAAQLDNFVQKYTLHQRSKLDRAKLSEAYKMATENCRKFLRVTRDVLKPMFGYQYSLAWNALGFVHSLMVPRSAAEVGPMMQAVRDYLAKHPATEIAAMNVTAAKATAVYEAFVTAQQALASHELASKTMARVRDAQAGVLQRMIRLLIAELTSLLPAVDPRWERFGLNQPGATERPSAPTNVTAEVGEENTINVKWTATPRAECHRVWLKIEGRDEEPLPVGTAFDLDYLIENMPRGSRVEISLTAINKGGESARSAPIRLDL